MQALSGGYMLRLIKTLFHFRGKTKEDNKRYHGSELLHVTNRFRCALILWCMTGRIRRVK